MTSLEETLPILDEAVPALPDKVEAVANESQAFEAAAREALADFEQRRAQAKALFEQVRHALEDFEAQANHERQGVEQVAQALPAAAEKTRQAADSGAQELKTAGQAADAALAALTTRLGQGSDRTRAAHDEARQALDTMDAHVGTSRTELERAVDAMVDDVESARQAVAEEQVKVAEGAGALKDALERLLGEFRTRLGETKTRLDGLRNEQETAVQVALSELTQGREQLAQALSGRLQADTRDGLDRELEVVEGALTAMGQQVVTFQAECLARRERLEAPFEAVSDLLAPLRAGVEQVREAASQVGIEWPG